MMKKGLFSPADSRGITILVNGILVRLRWQKGVPKYKKVFKFDPKSPASQLRALQSAVEYRDKKLKYMVSKGYIRNGRTITEPKCNNTSGILGVSFGRYKSKVTGKYTGSTFWQTTFKDKESGKITNCKFYCEKYGAEIAKDHALECYKAKKRLVFS